MKFVEVEEVSGSTTTEGRGLRALYLNPTWKNTLVGTYNCQFVLKAESLQQSHWSGEFGDFRPVGQALLKS